MKTYKLTIIENIVSGTLTKTREIKAKNEDDANKIFDELAHKGVGKKIMMILNLEILNMILKK